MKIKYFGKQWVSNMIKRRVLILCSLSLLAVGSVRASFTTTPGDLTFAEDASTNVSFTISDSAATITASSTNTALIPNGNVIISGAGTTRSVQITPVLNQYGTSQISLVMSTNSVAMATNQFLVTVTSVNDLPTISAITNKSTNEDTPTASISFTVGDVEDVLPASITVSSSNTNLVSAPVVGGSGSNRSIILSPNSNKNGSSIITVTVVDFLSATNSTAFTFTVNPVNDKPMIAGVANVSMNDDTNTSVAVFSGVSISDVDQGNPNNETVTVTLSFEDPLLIGTFDGVTGSNKVFTGQPAAVTASLQAFGFRPIPNRIAVGATTNTTVQMVVADSGGLKSTNSMTISVISVNDLPSISVSLNPSTIDDTVAGATPFSISIVDPDIGETFTASMRQVSDTNGIYGTLSSTTLSGTTIPLIQSSVRALRYTPNANVVEDNQAIDFIFTVVDKYSGTNSTPVSLTINEVADPPVISGTSSSLIQINDPTIENVAPFSGVTISDVDRQGNDPLTVQLLIDNPSLGTMSRVMTNGVTPAVASAWIRGALFTPNPGSIPVGTVQSVTLTVKVTDSSGILRSDNQTRVAITGFNQTPIFVGAPGSGEIKSFKTSDPYPFKNMWVTDDSATDLNFTITMDDVGKGTLTSSNFTGSSISTNTSLVGISNLLNTLTFTLSTNYPFSAAAPGDTTFTLTVEDPLENVSTAEVRIQLQERLRNFLVTRTDDDENSGSLRHALGQATASDFVTFALPSYPALIRLNPALGPVTPDRHVTIRGPGADLLRISGDTDGNGTADMQLFSIESSVTMEGLTLESGAAQNGGAIGVKASGALTMRSCVIKNSLAQQWGGAIDVEGGSLFMEGCLLLNNHTDEALGRGGGAVAIYSDQPASFVNTTFSANEQSAASGNGGGALFIENANPQTFLTADIIHCTFAENRDLSANNTSAVSVNSQGTIVRPMNSIFSDASGRNLQVYGGGIIESQGGNLADDSTFVLGSQSGQANAIYLLDHSDDETDSSTIALGPLTQLEGAMPIYPLLAGSTAIDTGLMNANIGVDQRGALRDANPDSGAYEFNSVSRVLINEIQAYTGSVMFVEFYIPRDSESFDFQGHKLFVDGSLRHVFSNSVPVVPGNGLVLADASVATPAAVEEVHPLNQAPFDFINNKGTITLQDSFGRTVVESSFVNEFPELGSLANISLTLSPQFSGGAFLPHIYVEAPPLGGWNSAKVGGATSSPGKDTGNTTFGALNASPIATDDAVVVGEDEVTLIQVLDNDSDADGSQFLVVTAGGGVTSNGATYSIAINTNTLLGTGITYDPTQSSQIQTLAAGAELTDSFSYSIGDYSIATTNPVVGGTSDTATVTLTLIGANDYPVAGVDTFAGTEEEVLRLMASPDLLGTSLVFDSDAAFEVPVRMETFNLLANDIDVDTDDSNLTLRVVGVLDSVQAINAFSNSVDGASVIVNSTSHGLETGMQILISGYEGYPGYNGMHVVTVLDINHFTIPVAYVDSISSSAVWGLLDNNNRLTAVSRLNGLVSLDIRADPAETSILYNPRNSAYLNSLALGENDTDVFYYAVSDSHGAVSIGQINVVVSGVNETPMNRPDPDPLFVLDPFVGNGTLEDVLGGLTVLDRSGSDARSDVRVQLAGQSEADSVVLSNLWMTLENVQLEISSGDLLMNDADEDTSDVLRVYSASSSMLGIPVMLVSNGVSLVYDTPTTTTNVLDALAHNEMILDSFEVVITDDHGGFVTNSVAILVVGVNDAPKAFNDYTTTKEDIDIELAPIEFPFTNSASWDYDVDINDTQPDDSLWIIETNGLTKLGAEFAITNNTYDYDPSVSIFLDGLALGVSTTDVVNYTLTDQSFIFANDDLFRVEANGNSFELNILANDRNYNVRPSPFVVTSIGIPDNGGMVETNETATGVIYTPAVNYVGDEVFTYTVEDGFGNMSRGRVMVQVTAETFNGHIQANDDFFTVARGESVSLPVLANDNTLPALGTDLIITGISGTNGTALVNISDTVLNFTPLETTNTTYPNTITFNYEVSGGGSARGEAQVTVKVIDRFNDKELSRSDHFHVTAGSLDNPLDVVANDTILPDANTVTIDEINVLPKHGTASIDSGNNRLIYTPNSGYIGSDQLRYKVVDQLGGRGDGIVTITVGVPQVANDTYVVVAGSTNHLNVLANDRALPAMPGSLAITGVTTASGGSVSISTNAPGLEFIAGNTLGSTTFEYTIEDSYPRKGQEPQIRSLSGTVTVSIVSPGTYANTDTFLVPAGGEEIVLNVLANDRSLPDNRNLAIIGIGSGTGAPNQGGALHISADYQSLVYTPALGFVGEETFTYFITDASGFDAARVTVRVGAPAIGASDDSYFVYYEGAEAPSFTLQVLNNDVLLPESGGLLEIVGVGINDSNGTNAPAQPGSVVVAGDGQSLIYTPSAAGEESFTYEVSDGSVNRTFATVSVNVLLREDIHTTLSTVNADRYSVARNSSGNTLAVLNNDGARPAGTSGWTITNAGTPFFGGQVIVVDNSVIYTPLPGFVGTDRFTYSVSDGLGGTGEAEVQVKVGDIVLNEDLYTVVSGTQSNVLDVLVNDGIYPGPEYNLMLDSAGSLSGAGSVAMASNMVYYTPGSAYTGAYPYVETFEYMVLDDSGMGIGQQVSVLVVEEGSDRDYADILVTVEGVNDSPIMRGFSDLLETDDKTPIKPYSVASVTDVDNWGDELQTVEISIDSIAKGELVSLGGFSHLGNGIYRMTNTPAQVTASLRGLQYQPVENRIPGGMNEVVELDIQVKDPYIPQQLTSHLQIVVWAANDAPVISGIVDPLNTVSSTAVMVFPTTVLTDVDEQSGQELSVEIVLNDAAKGTLSNLGGFVEKIPGRWEMSGSPAALTSVLQGLLFEPSTNRLDIGDTEIARFKLNVADSFVASPVSATVNLTITGANVFRESWLMQHFGTNQTISANNADPDGDQLSNIQEYVFGTDPTVQNDDSAHNLEMQLDAATGTFTVSYNRRVDDPTLTYVLQKSADLNNWADASLVVISESSATVSPGIERITVTFQQVDDQSYYRMRVHY